MASPVTDSASPEQLVVAFRLRNAMKLVRPRGGMRILYELSKFPNATASTADILQAVNAKWAAAKPWANFGPHLNWICKYIAIELGEKPENSKHSLIIKGDNGKITLKKNVKMAIDILALEPNFIEKYLL